MINCTIFDNSDTQIGDKTIVGIHNLQPRKMYKSDYAGLTHYCYCSQKPYQVNNFWFGVIYIKPENHNDPFVIPVDCIGTSWKNMKFELTNDDINISIAGD